MTRARLAVSDVIASAEQLRAWRGLLDRVVQARTGLIARAEPGPRPLCILPAGANVVAVLLYGVAGSDAGAAGIRIGVDGAPGHYLPLFDVKAPAGVGQIVPPARRLGDVGAADIVVLGEYLESGAPSSAGGPWGVAFLITRV